jgi:hypothetical protein
MQRVVQVSADTINLPEPHKHITSVKCIAADAYVDAAGSKLIIAEQAPEIVELTVGEVYERMKAGEGFWVKYDDDSRERWLHIHACPVCGTDPYICDDTTSLPDEEH